MPVVNMRQLLEAGVHFGHQTRRWNPKMRPYIFGERNGIHIIDLQKTIRLIDHAYQFVRDVVADGGIVLFVGTKKQAKEAIKEHAIRAGMPYINHRWLGGTLTNFVTIRKSLEKYKDLLRKEEEGVFEKYPQKEASRLRRKLEKMRKVFDGIKELQKLPDIVYIVDIVKEETAVREANRLGIPIVAMVDTNADPELVDYVIPSNDDAIRAVNLITSVIADAVIEGRQIYSERTGEPVGVGALTTAAEETASVESAPQQHFLSAGMQEDEESGDFEDMMESYDYGEFEEESENAEED